MVCNRKDISSYRIVDRREPPACLTENLFPTAIFAAPSGHQCNSQRRETLMKSNITTPRSASQAISVTKPIVGTFVLAAAFSLAINLLVLTSPLYMFQVFDRVLSSGDRKSTRLNSSHSCASRLPSSA